ncbi:MAG: helix-turn-helix transcriptional regulator [Bacteroidales bacterium]|nr:helix-turn-helix transcriptional regulator [Bacteroidales bacterium]MBQ5891957.1 helix-turn-helix transcriptional regulator [Bacteroidales bacterium]
MNFDINKLFGKKLVELRKKQNISQEELADRCGFHRTYIGSLERGEKSPTLNTLEKLSKGLNIEIQDFFK